MQKAVRWLCAVCGRGIGNNSILVVRSGYTGNVGVLKGSMYKVMKTIVCRGSMNPVAATGCTSVDIGVNANLELVDKFYCLGDILSVDGDVVYLFHRLPESI